MLFMTTGVWDTRSLEWKLLFGSAEPFSDFIKSYFATTSLTFDHGRIKLSQLANAQHDGGIILRTWTKHLYYF